MSDKIKELEALTDGRRNFLSGLLSVFAKKEKISNEIKEGLGRISCYFGIKGYNLSNLRGIRECYYDFAKIQEAE